MPRVHSREFLDLYSVCISSFPVKVEEFLCPFIICTVGDCHGEEIVLCAQQILELVWLLQY